MPTTAVLLPLLRAGVLVGVTATPSAAVAGDEPYALTYQSAGVACPNEAAVRADVAAHVHDPARAAGARVEVGIRQIGIRAQADLFVGELTVTDPSGARGHRKIEGEQCADVAHALAFLAGLALELGGRLDPEARRAAAPPPPRPVPLLPATAADPDDGLALAAVGAGGLRGALPDGPRPVAEIGVEHAARTTRLWSPLYRISAVVSDAAPEGADWTGGVLLASGRLEACPLRIGPARVDVRPCAAGEMGLLSTRSRWTAGSRSTDDLWIAVEAAGRLRWWATSALFVDLAAGALFPLRRPRLPLGPGGVGYDVPAVAPRVVFGAGLRF